LIPIHFRLFPLRMDRMGAQARKNAVSAFSLHFRGWKADVANHDSHRAPNTGKKFRIPFRLNAADGGPRPEDFLSGVAPFRQHCPA
jgi:hypothetical protein